LFGAPCSTEEKVVISIIFLLSYKKLFHMALIPNNKKKKDGKPLAGPKSNIPGFPAGKGKANTKGVVKNTRLTGGSQRGS
jgi:hypothetical protein